MNTPPPPPPGYPQPQPPQPYSMGYPPHQQQSPQPAVRGVNGLGIAALVLGIVAAVFIWIPLCGIAAYPLAGIGLLLGVIGLILALTNKRSSPVMAIVGSVVCVLAVVVGTVSLRMQAKWLEKTAAEVERKAKEQQDLLAKEMAEQNARDAAGLNGLPSFEVTSEPSGLDVNTSEPATVTAVAWGNLTEENVGKLLSHLAVRNPAASQVDLYGRVKRAGQPEQKFHIGGKETGEPATIDAAGLAEYRKAARLDPPTKPATRPSRLPPRR